MANGGGSANSGGAGPGDVRQGRVRRGQARPGVAMCGKGTNGAWWRFRELRCGSAVQC